MKPNHYHHDNLGCPMSCREDHNHPFDIGDLTTSEANRHLVECGNERSEPVSPEEVELAKTAACLRCGVQIVGSSSLIGTVMVNYYLPAVGIRKRGVLCGACGLVFREFLQPELEHNPAHQAIVAELRKLW